ncbi:MULTISPECIES: NAD(P)-dependent oxidoreductase [unclassified Microbacterium]|uniref:NAD-dependent epimerase/dehydratase family protein n=1 Tax=unclassified Microbacterium TaxID=2609290 RepID=UPI001605465B|nr:MULTISPECIES: NAD(P)-dependent oxidoreductase [unclassified Microbacterium]QNA93597.1 NAD(P)-dependent oxidoreductase [Microbacterium sp. Se63.02b]QYM63856.1 NAD(P)-dependent oxidoreductase [Microbacterium sp. Se5.02b]
MTPDRHRVLVTGAAGSIATAFVRATADEYEFTLLDLPGTLDAEQRALGSVVEVDLADISNLRGVMDGIDTVLHLAGQRSPSTLWEDLLPANIVGTYNVVAAAVAAKVPRVIYASSVHTVTGYTDGQIRESDPVQPDDLYGVTKCFGEALGAFAVSAEDLRSFVALRIGAFQDPAKLAAPDAGWMLRDYLAPDDFVDMLGLLITSDRQGFDIYNATSANRFGRLSMTKAAEELGFVPRSDAFAIASPFATAIAEVGGLDDRPALSGMRADVARLRGH